MQNFMKRLALGLSLCLLVSMFGGVTSLAESAAPLFYGDVNGDGAVDSTDARLVLQHEVKLIGLEEEQRLRADVSGDGVVDSSDARMMLQMEVGLVELKEEFAMVVVCNGKIQNEFVVIDEMQFFNVAPGYQLCLLINGEPIDQSVIWFSNNPEGINIDENGFVFKVLGDKKAVITALLNNGRSFQIAVYTNKLGLLLDDHDVVHKVSILEKEGKSCDNMFFLYDDNKVVKLSAAVVFGEHETFPGVIVWTSDDSSVATVDSDGLVTILKVGRTLIKAIADDKYDYVYLNVI